MRKLIIRNVRELDEPRPLRIQLALWRFGHIARGILICLPPLALLGIFAGRGPLSEHVIRSAGASGEITASYERLLHRDNETQLMVDVRPARAGDIIIRVSGDVITRTSEFETHPAPVDVTPRRNAIDYRIYAAAEGARVTARYRPIHSGFFEARIEIVCATCPGPTPPVELRQFVYP